MLPLPTPIEAAVDSKTYPLGENSAHRDFANALALVALNHTTVQQRLYSAMLSANANNNGEFTARRLADMTGIRNLSTIRRGLDGLVAKLSAERNHENGNGRRDSLFYRVFPPAEVLQRRRESGAREVGGNPNGNHHALERAISRVSENVMLSRREAQVALCCVEGLTNADIGRRLEITEQTVKFHLRHIFVKFAVKRRAELISRLLS
jgi:DNA-binding CsgD family transcriptional regulator